MVNSAVSYESCLEAAGIAIAGGDRPTAERALRAAVEAASGTNGSPNQLAIALAKFGALKLELGSHEEAEDLFAKALEVSEAAFGDHDLSLVSPLKGLGTARMLRGSPEEAEPVLTRALAIGESQLGANHPDLVILLNDLTRLYLKQGAHAFAEPLLLRLLALKRSKGDDHPEVATVLASLAAVRQSLGRYEAAEQLWRRVLEIRERTLSPNHFSLATTLEHLADSCAARGKFREALHFCERALTIRELTLGPDHASLRVLRERIADLQLQAGEDSMDSDFLSLLDRPRLSAGPPPTARASDEIPAPIANRVSAPPPMAPPPPPAHAPVPPPIARPQEPKAARPSPAPEPRREPPRQQAPSREATRAAADRAFGPVQPAVEKQNGAHAAGATRAEAKAGEKASESVPYLNVLLDIQRELADTAEHGAERAAKTTGVAAWIRERQTAVIVGAAVVVALPLAALAAMKVAGSERVPGWVDASAVTASRPTVDSAAVTLASSLTTGSPFRDTTARSLAGSTLVARAREDNNGTSTRAAEPDVPTISVPTLSVGTARLDSVVRAATAAPMRAAGESVRLPSAATLDLRRGLSSTSGPARGPTRARLLGTLPTPHYPDQLVMAGIGGEVRIRFEVDTMGRPVLNTFAVLTSPHELLTAAVRRVIPQMQFDPARSPWPEARAITDVIELGFQFTARRRED